MRCNVKCLPFYACHMLKLLCNCLEAFKEIILNGTGKASWCDIVRLHKLQKYEGLRAGNRLTAAHVQFQQQKMEVRLAAQTLSSSVATAFEYLQKNGYTANGTATQSFILTID